jgi:hypothetical protein
MVGFEADVSVEHFFRQPLQQHAGDQPVQITFVSEDHVWLGQRLCHWREPSRICAWWPVMISGSGHFRSSTPQIPQITADAFHLR